ncbi:PrsW family glutamic-type intramembrane protease [Phycicoccus sonneratiae]|uniref:PrsW family intramembrane metalloprotease n=1 Tax=Phycicoccus sonneratiae TaxID=2807628 RepID=A0ABS2CLT7_9MICO|nr:PrsW family glutamic-type intramembrane protease [Phycicoccus sonneraticus]MBM6400793.1 PrsW family intramembrane metalloprotease [Phycicoccus sonneraticus]
MLLLMVVAAIVAVTQLTVLGSPARSVRWSTVVQALAVGALVCGVGAAVLQWGWTRAVGALGVATVADVQRFAAWTVDPVIEEVAKVLPLLWLAWRRPRAYRQLGYVDHLLLGAALGMGFELLEAVLRFSRLGLAATHVHGGYLVSAGLGGTVTVPSLWTSGTSWLPVPAAYSELFASAGDTPQHLVWTAFAALGIAWFGRRRDALRLLGLLPTLGVALDHANYNARLELPPHADGVLSDLLAWFGDHLHLLLVPALLVAVVLDRLALARGRRERPDVLLAGERTMGLDAGRLARLVTLAPPWSTLVTWQFVLSRRAALRALAAGTPEPGLADGIAPVARALEAPGATAAWQGAGRRLLGGLDLSALRSWRLVLWALALVPAVLYLVLGAFPFTASVQRALTSTVGLWLLAAGVLAGGLLTASQLRGLWTSTRAVPQPSLHEVALRRDARFATALSSLGVAVLMLALTVVERDPNGRVAPTFHVLDALSTLLLVAGLALVLMSFVMFPPSLLFAVGAGGLLVPVLEVSSAFVLTLTTGAILAESGVLMNQANDGGGGGGRGSGGDPPPRYTDNTSRTRTYGKSVADIKGQANRWAARMRARGFDADVPPVRYGKYGWADVTVRAVKGGRELIRHFIYKGP